MCFYIKLIQVVSHGFWRFFERPLREKAADDIDKSEEQDDDAQFEGINGVNDEQCGERTHDNDATAPEGRLRHAILLHRPDHGRNAKNNSEPKMDEHDLGQEPQHEREQSDNDCSTQCPTEKLLHNYTRTGMRLNILLLLNSSIQIHLNLFHTHMHMPGEMCEYTVKTMPSSSHVTLLLSQEEIAQLPQKRSWTDSDLLSSLNLRFEAASRIAKYFCDKCDQERVEKPQGKIFIRSPREDLPLRSIGEAWYHCTACDTSVHYAYIQRSDSIDIKDIIRDERGEFIKPTPQTIESELEEALKLIAEDPETDAHEYHITVAETWANKIGYTISSEQITNIRKTKERAYIEHYQSNLKETLKNLLSRGTWSLAEEEFGSEWAMSGLGDQFHDFYQILPKIQLPTDPEIRNLVCHVLKRYETMFQQYVAGKEEELKTLENKVNDAREEAQQVSQDVARHLSQHGIPKEMYENANPVSFVEIEDV